MGIQETNQLPKVTWFGSATLQSAGAVAGPYTNVLSITNVLTNGYTPSAVKPEQFFRLQYPPYPSF
jgi:hypothetical protein